MMSEPNAPLFECLIGSDDIRPGAPNSMGWKTPLLVVDELTSPAYHWYLVEKPGLTVCTGFCPTLMPFDRVTSKKRFCGCSPTSDEGVTWLALKCSTIIGIVLKPGMSGAPGFGSLLVSVTSIQSPALARSTRGSRGTPLASLPVVASMSVVRTNMIA